MDTIASFNNASVYAGSKPAFENVSFDVKRGEKVFIMGSDGSGKSSILKVLVGLLNFRQGSVHVFGKNINDLSRKQLVEVRKKIGFVFQEGALAANLTIIENLMLPLRYHSVYNEDLIPNIAEELLAMVGMQDYCDYYPIELNIGMKKKVGIARALTMNPELVLYDDPSLDMAGLARRKLEEHIIWLHNKLGITSIVVSSNLEFAKREADKLIIMNKGKLIAFGTLDELGSGADEKIKNFLVTGNLTKIF
ncbi:MAG: ABC transporter ATP-binding protein [Candidatus Anammoxibacter sp.]